MDAEDNPAAYARPPGAAACSANDRGFFAQQEDGRGLEPFSGQTASLRFELRNTHT